MIINTKQVKNMLSKIISFLIFFILPIHLYSQNPETLLTLAEKQMSDKELIIAEETLKKALKIDPSFAPAFQALSKLSLQKGDLTTANSYSIQAVQSDEDFRAWSEGISEIAQKIQNGRANIQKRMYEEAIKEYSEILSDFPYFPEAAFYIGLTYFKQKDIEGAAKYFKQALDIYPEHGKAKKGLDNVTKQFLNNGNNAYKRGDIEKATNYYKKAIEFDDSFYLAYFQLGVLEKKMGKSDDAIRYLNNVIKIKPDHDKSWFTLASVYESDGNYKDAILNYEKAIEINSNYSKAYGNLGKLYTIEGNYELAEKILNSVIKIDDQYADGFMHLGHLYLMQEKYNLAFNNLKISTELDNRDYNKFFQLATAANSLDKWDDGSRAAQKCTELQKRFGGGWYEWGLSEFGKGNKTRAKRYFDEAHKDRDWRELAARKIDEINNPQKYQK